MLDAAIASIEATDVAPVVQLPQRAEHRSASRRGTSGREADGPTRSNRQGRSMPWRGAAAAVALVALVALVAAGAGGALGIKRIVDPSRR